MRLTRNEWKARAKSAEQRVVSTSEDLVRAEGKVLEMTTALYAVLKHHGCTISVDQVETTGGADGFRSFIAGMTHYYDKDGVEIA